MPRTNGNSFVSLEVTSMSGDIAVTIELRKHNSTSFVYQQVAPLLQEHGLQLANADLILVTQSGARVLPHDILGNYMTDAEHAEFLERGRQLDGRKGIALNMRFTAVAQRSHTFFPWYLDGVAPPHGLVTVADRLDDED